jgi:hypothetical protein
MPLTRMETKDDKGYYRVPDLDATDDQILDFKRRHFNFYSVLRNRQMERMARNLLYTYGRQWIELDTEVILAGSRGYVFRDKKSNPDYQMPRPTTNLVAPAVDLEISSLGKRELIPTVVPRSRDPRIEAAAKAAKEILLYRLEELDWPAVRELAIYLTVVCGTGILKSWWDDTYADVTLVQNPSAVSCPSCGVSFSSPRLSQTHLGIGQNNAPQADFSTLQEVPQKPEDMLGDDGMPTSDGSPTLQMQTCPFCPGQQLQPGQMSEEEAQGTDLFGRPLGMYVPKGNTSIEVVSPFDLFPENSGIEVTPETCRIWGQASVRSLDWIEERWPDKIDSIQPEDPADLMRNHSILGDWNLLGRFNSALDSAIYDNHARVYELHVKPGYRFPNGRSIIIANDTILKNDELIKTLQLPNGQSVSAPSVLYSATRFKTRHKEFWGIGLVDDLISPQNRVNGMDAQIIDARERTGSPNLLVPDTVQLTGPAWNEDYGSGKLMTYIADSMNPNIKPEVFGSVLFPIGVYQERDRLLQDMKTIAGPQDIEQGEAPKNITTTSGLQILGEQAERRRGTRERGITEMFEKTWEHQLQLIWCFRTDKDQYERENEEGTWEIKEYDREAVGGQTKVKIEKQAYVDKSLYQKEAAREAQADGLYRLDSQSAIKKLLELRNLPTDVNDSLNRQVDVGKEQWVDFVDDGIVPVIDLTLDDPGIRFEVLGTYLLTDEGRDMERTYQWAQTLKMISGWQQQLQLLEQQDAQVKTFYGGRIPQQQANQMYAQAMAAWQPAMQSYETAAASSAAAGQPLQTPPPQQPPPPVFLPPALEDKIYMVWKQMIAEAQQDAVVQGTLPPSTQPGDADGDEAPMPPQVQAQKADDFLKFRAVVDAYKILRDRQQGQMAAPQPGQPGMDSNHPGPGNNPPTPPQPPPAPGVTVNSA